MKNRIKLSLKSPQPIDIYLPSCKEKLGEIIDDTDFKINNIFIDEPEIIGYSDIRFSYGSTIHEYNLLAEKLDKLSDDQRELLYSVLDTRRDNFSQLVVNITPQNICSIIDNLHNFRLHENKNSIGFDKLLRCASNEINNRVVEYIGTENSYINNYEEYEKYEMPLNYDYIEVTLAEVDNADYKVTLKFPLNDETNIKWVEEMGDRKFEILEFESKFKPYIKFDVGKEELSKLNDFATMYFDKFEISQKRFIALFEYYDDMISQEIQGISFDEYFEIYDKLDEFEIWGREGFKNTLVEKFCEFNKIRPESKSFIDGEKLFNELFECEPIYVTEKDMYVYRKDFIVDLLERQKDGTLNQNEENSFDMEM